MSSRKEEERNEKIIRGLMKLPPNRRCINCNSLGPQYVCTNFWTFVCMTCSGIHREFTHRVKSVSMSKFTSQEVEALQRGGNQRARETFLKYWDQQRQRLPDSSNVDKVRDFIKNVYVDRRYVDGKTSDKPPRDIHKHGNHEDETRRASSYHSYSQSPPYDFQYEERRYGKQTAMLTRKPGSDRGLYDRKVSSFLSSSQLSDHLSEDGHANEGSNSRASNYSLSSGGDPVRSDIQSPNFQRDVGLSSPSSDTSRDFITEDLHYHPTNSVSGTTANRIAIQGHRPQRSTSLSSFGSFDGNTMSFKSVSSVSLADVASEPEQHASDRQDKLSTAYSLPLPSAVGKFGSLDLFDAPFALQNIASSASASEVPHPAKTSSSRVDLFQPSPVSSVPPFDSRPAQNSLPPSLDLFSHLEIPQQQSAATLTEKAVELIIPKNEGWATFDVPQNVSLDVGIENSSPARPSTDGGSLGKFDAFSSLDTSLQWPAFHSSNAHASLAMPELWRDGLHNVEASVDATSTQSWDAFANSNAPPLQSLQSDKSVAAQNSFLVADQYLGFDVSQDSIKNGNQNPLRDNVPHIPGILSHASEASYLSSPYPMMQAGGHAHATNQKSTNPFDLPDDSDLEPGNMFLDISSWQAVMPSGQVPTSCVGSATQPWFPQNSISYMPAGSQGPLGYMAGQGSSTQIANVPTQGPAASIGGNPFA